MCQGVTLPLYQLPIDLVERWLSDRVCERGGEREVQFLRRHKTPLLPVWYQGQLRVAPWGCRRGESQRLPPTGWTWKDSVEHGKWNDARAEPVDIPAALALERGIWFKVRQGLRGLLARDEQGLPRVYVIIEPSSHYFEVMTRSKWMPVLIGERI